MEDDDLAEPLMSRSKSVSFAQQDEDTAHGLFNDAEAQAVEEAALLLCMESLWNGEVPTKDIRFSAAADMAASRQQLDCVLSRIRPSTEPASRNLLRARLQPRCADTDASLSGLLNCVNSEIESLPHLAQVLARQVFVAERLRTAAGDSSHDDDDSAAAQQAADIHEDDLMPVLLQATAACCAAIEQQQPALHDVGALLAAGHFDDIDSDDECTGDASAASRCSLRRLRVTVQSLAGTTTFEEEEDYDVLSDDDSDPLDLDSFEAAFAEASSDAPLTATAAVHAAEDEAAAVAAVRQLVRSLREAVRAADPVLPSAAATAAAVHMATAAVACAHSAAAAADASVRTALGPLSARLRVTTNCPDARKLCPVAVVRVGVRQWGAAHYGLGFAVETQARVRVGLASAADTAQTAASAASEDVQWWSGSVVCDVCQAFALRDGADCAELEQIVIASSSSSSSAAAGEADVFYDAAEALTAADRAASATGSDQQQRSTEPCAGYVCLRLRPEELVLRSPTELSDVSEHFSSADAPSATTATTAAAAGVQLVPGCLRDSDKRRTAGGGATELLGFGANEFGCLGLPRGAVRVAPRPRSLPLRGLLPSERVLCVACSSRHTVLVTSLGAVFTAGDASSGALGHGPPTAATTATAAASYSAGDSSSSDRLRRVEWFSDAAPQPLLVAAAAGSDLLGCHSMALCSEGRVYAWGLGAATGTGTARTVWLPALVQLPKQQSTAVVAVVAPAATTTAAEAVDDSSKVTAIACGCAFSLALTASGAVYSWGAVAWGRLGCGLPQPVGTATAAGAAAAGSRSRGTGRTRVQRFQLRPRCVTGLPQRSPAVAIAAGGWHGLALTASGSVYSWGRNSSGQLGRGPLTADGWWPGRVTSFDTATTGNSTSSSTVRVRAIAAGAAHSAAVDAAGTAWTWGGGGGALLGHGELSARPTLRDDHSSSSFRAAAALNSGSSTAQQQQLQQQQLLLRPKRLEDSEPVRAARAAAQGWDRPRAVAALQGVQLRAVACGAAHTAFVTVDSRLYLCGEGPCLATAAAADDYDATAATASTATASTAGDDNSSVVLMAPPVPVPREPCAVFLPALAGHCVGAVACGGAHTLVLTAGQSIGSSLGRVLLAAAEARASGYYYSDDAAAYADSTSNSSSNSSPTAPDTLLIVGGTYLHAHRCILARRSPVLRELIAAEERPDGASLADIATADSTSSSAAVAPLQLLLPNLRPEVARALREFLYTDALAHPLDPAAPLVHDLLAAAKAYQVTRLAAICSAAIAPPYYEQLLRKQTARASAGSRSSSDFNLVTLPPSTLAADLGGALGESEHADVRFLAGGRPIYAHRAVLCARSEYFAAMFSSGMAESSTTTTSSKRQQQQQQQRCVDVVVPDSHVGMLRLLLFLYSGTLPPAAADTLLEDLLSADRYRLLNMVSLALMCMHICTICATRRCAVSVVIANTWYCVV
jgi:alpha-tubulin suppressor-like RCC1 family protein